jgi:copper(I)-binding protein
VVGCAALLGGLLAGCGSSAAPTTTPAADPARQAAAAATAAERIGGHGRLGSLAVSGAYVPAPASPDVAAAYFTVHNRGDTPDALVAVSTALTPDASLHHYVRSDGAEQMAPLARLAVPPHGRAVLQPGGNHLMLMHPNRQLRQGDRVTLTLHFAHAGTLALSVPVVSAAGLSDTNGAPMPSMNRPATTPMPSMSGMGG